jgi:hypothetical protein
VEQVGRPGSVRAAGDGQTNLFIPD